METAATDGAKSSCCQISRHCLDNWRQGIGDWNQGWTRTQLEPDLPGDYSAALATLKDLVREAQHRAQRVVNTAMIELYWNIGHTFLERQRHQPWGSSVLERIARDLRAELPHLKGFSRTNMYNMRAFAAAWSEKTAKKVPSWHDFIVRPWTR